MEDKNPVKRWEELRRSARRYENDIDSKLFSLGKLMSSRQEQKLPKRFGSGMDDEQPLISHKENFDHLTFEIESLLSSLQEVNHEMSQIVQNLPNSNATLYTIQRHQEILNDYRKEFFKIRTNIEEQLNRDLLFDNSKNKNDYSEFTMPSHLRKNDFLMKENDHIRNSEIMIDEQISIAIRTRESLRHQHSLMKSFQTQLTTLANKFPMINNIMHRVSVKKRKDSIVIAIVIAICLFILLFWIF